MIDSKPFNNPLVVALDVDTREQALRLADQLKGIAGGLKVGPRLCLRFGADFVKEIAQRAPVFMDNKHFDIPSTMEAAVRASFDAGASVVTVHALSGREALMWMAKLEAELNQIRPFRILAVTILTSWDEKSFTKNFKLQKISAHVTDLVDEVAASGLKGIVCSPEELTLLKDRGLYLVTPGIRVEADSKDDQKRIASPAEALKNGASALVVGRPVIQAADPVAAARKILENCR